MAPDTAPLKILIAGAGIGGLAAALGVRGEGHNVEMFEKSKFNDEVGAALVVPPNVDGLLKRMGFDAGEHGATREGASNLVAYQILVESLHEGLKSKALAAGVKIDLQSPIRSVDAEEASITLENGKTVKGDAVIGADGIHISPRWVEDSINLLQLSYSQVFAKPSLLKPQTLVPFGVSTFRLLIPSSIISRDPLAKLFTEKKGNLTVWDDQRGKRFITYPYRNNTLLNIVALFPKTLAQPEPSDPNLKEMMIELFGDWSEHVRALIELADKVMIWRLLGLPTLHTWSRGRAVLIGDAAHPLLPYAAQCGAQAIEDASTLTALLPRSTSPSSIPARLKLFHNCRHQPVNFIQEFSLSMALLIPSEDNEVSSNEHQATNGSEQQPTTNNQTQEALTQTGQGIIAPLMPYDQFNQIVFRHDAWTWAEEALAWEEGSWGELLRLKVVGAGRFVKKGVGTAWAVWKGR